MIESTLHNTNLSDKHILLRADLNVPIKNGTIVNDFRMLKLLPTIKTILNNDGNIVLITHIGRPTKPDPSLSTKQLVPWFEKHGYTVTFCPTLEDAQSKIKEGNRFILLENLRFFPGEQGKDQAFAKKLASLGDYYVNDAFATMHRDDASITLVPQLFPLDQKTIGLLAEQELKKLSMILHNTARPFALIIGGGKVETKIPLLSHLIDKIDMLFLCPAIVFSFLKAQGEPVGKSLINPAALDQCKDMLKAAQERNVSVFFPIDYQIAMNTFEGPLSQVPANEIPENGVGISIGSQTVDLFAQEFNKAKTIVYNGLMGDINRPETIETACALFKAMAHTKAHTIIAGGDSVAAAQECDVLDTIEWCSTGGGATIAYLSGERLPGLTALEQ